MGCPGALALPAALLDVAFRLGIPSPSATVSWGPQTYLHRADVSGHGYFSGASPNCGLP